LFIVKQKLMKKFSFISNAVLLGAVVTFLFLACQKEQNAVSDDQVTTSENVRSVGVTGGGSFAGSIDGSYAAALQNNFAKKYDEDNQTLKVAFSAKELLAFINSLQTKYNSDIIYVNFGVYGKGAFAPNPKDNGRLTVFFTGNNINNSSGNTRTTGMDASSSDQRLNHGEIFP
jgi:hypothetical protein